MSSFHRGGNYGNGIHGRTEHQRDATQVEDMGIATDGLERGARICLCLCLLLCSVYVSRAGT